MTTTAQYSERRVWIRTATIRTSQQMIVHWRLATTKPTHNTNTLTGTLTITPITALRLTAPSAVRSILRFLCTLSVSSIPPDRVHWTQLGRPPAITSLLSPSSAECVASVVVGCWWSWSFNYGLGWWISCGCCRLRCWCWCGSYWYARWVFLSRHL